MESCDDDAFSSPFSASPPSGGEGAAFAAVLTSVFSTSFMNPSTEESSLSAAAKTCVRFAPTETRVSVFNAL